MEPEVTEVKNDPPKKKGFNWELAGKVVGAAATMVLLFV